MKNVFARAVVVAVSVALAAGNSSAQTNNPPAAAKDAPAAEKDAQKQAPGVRKLSRRERKDRMKTLSDKHRQFLEDVEPIMQPTELDTFLVLETEPQRDIYIEDFWHRRDVAAGTTNRAFKDLYYSRLEDAKERFKWVSSDRSKMLLIHGDPNEVIKIDCSRYLQPLEIWKYQYVQGYGHDVRFLFYMPRVGGSDYKMWIPLLGNEDLAQLLSSEAVSGATGNIDEAVRQAFFTSATGGGFQSRIEWDCRDGDELLRAIAQVQLNKTDLVRVYDPPPVNEEDVHKILRAVVLATPNAPKLTADLTVAYPAKQGSRTDTQLTILVPRSQLTAKEVGGVKTYSIDVTGEVLKDDQLFENYRYRFDFPQTTDEKLPVTIDRFLRPADYKARVKVTDANATAEAILEKDLTVPEIFDTPEQRKMKENGATTVAQLKDDIESADTRLRIVPLSEDLVSGVQHIETIAYGENIKSVEFYLDGRKIMVKRQPPYTLDLDFGIVPQMRKVRAVALDEKGQILTGDELVVNTGTDPFRVRIVSPRVAPSVHGKTRIEMDAHVPEGKQLDHLELYLNDTKVATLYDRPFVQTINIPQAEGVGYLRVVAKLKDDAAAQVEDLVMINTPQFMEEVNVHLVELPTTVLANGRPVTNLPETAFKVLDDGKPVKVTKFEYVKNLPLSIGLAIDTSGSMLPRMSEAQKAGSQFFSNVLRTGDKAFLVSFDTQPQLVQRWSPRLADVNAGLAKLRAEEATALYDAVVYSLYNFLGVKGQKALIVISDGRDTASKFTFDQAIEYARRAAVPIYGIGIGIRSTDVDVRYKFGRFASETGGTVYYIDNAADLRRIYDDIQNELRSQYVLGFYPPDGVKPGGKWREVQVQVGEGKAKTIRGYYP
jgi:Ca-activated chloride channel family protein